MSGPYPEIERWVIPRRVLTATLTGVQLGGRGGMESGAFWLGQRRAISEVEAVVLPAGTGVQQKAYQWSVPPEVFGTVTRWAKPRNLSLLGIVHTHVRGVPPRLSWADRQYSVQVPGVLAVVIGNGGGDHNHRDWGWYVYEQGDYRIVPGAEFAERFQIGSDARVEIWRADAFVISEILP